MHHRSGDTWRYQHQVVVICFFPKVHRLQFSGQSLKSPTFRLWFGLILIFCKWLTLSGVIRVQYTFNVPILFYWKRLNKAHGTSFLPARGEKVVVVLSNINEMFTRDPVGRSVTQPSLKAEIFRSLWRSVQDPWIRSFWHLSIGWSPKAKEFRADQSVNPEYLQKYIEVCGYIVKSSKDTNMFTKHCKCKMLRWVLTWGPGGPGGPGEHSGVNCVLSGPSPPKTVGSNKLSVSFISPIMLTHK